jgi:FMN phosphatase YigB (HAD superfamily)
MRLLITDLDNTLYDWVTYFATSFQAMVDSLAKNLGVDEERLLDEFKTVHQHYGNSEQPFAVFELPSVRSKYGNLSDHDLLHVLEEPLGAFNSQRNNQLRLYPTVRQTLNALHDNGVRIVAHTEAIAVNAYYRLYKLGIDDLFHRIYALKGNIRPHPDPKRGDALRMPEGLLNVVPKEERKPNPELLYDICHREGIRPEDAWYVGDSLIKDVAMANRAGVTAVWARYGTNYDPELWKTLVRVTHWTDGDVKREEELHHLHEKIKPDFTIDVFGEILALSGFISRIEDSTEEKHTGN